MGSLLLLVILSVQKPRVSQVKELHHLLDHSYNLDSSLGMGIISERVIFILSSQLFFLSSLTKGDWVKFS